MMKAPDLWYRDDRAVLDSLPRSGSRRVLRKTQMRPGLFVVLEVVSKNPPRVVLIQHDHMVETLPPRRSDEPLDVRILPGRPWSRDDLLYPKSGHPAFEDIAVD